MIDFRHHSGLEAMSQWFFPNTCFLPNQLYYSPYQKYLLSYILDIPFYKSPSDYRIDLNMSNYALINPRAS